MQTNFLNSITDRSLRKFCTHNNYTDSPLHLTYISKLPLKLKNYNADFNGILHVRPQNSSCSGCRNLSPRSQSC